VDVRYIPVVRAPRGKALADERDRHEAIA
jgi:hypothetical protein